MSYSALIIGMLPTMLSQRQNDDEGNYDGLRDVIFFGFFLSPLPTFWKICQHKSVEHFSPIPYLAMLFNCMMWFFYGLPIVKPRSTLVSTVNGVGIFFMAAYITVFFIFSNRKLRLKMTKILLAETVAMVTVVLSALHTHSGRSLLVGIIAGVSCVIMHASPLSVMRRVIKTESVKYMPLCLSLAGFINSICWTAYALFGHFDRFIAIPNGLGVLLGLVQLILYGGYYSTTPRDEGEDRPELQLPTVAANTGTEKGFPDGCPEPLGLP